MNIRRTPIRTNVLALMLAGYVVVLAMFLILVVFAEQLTVEEAYEIIQGPLMALIGGSLAISKDLIPLGDNGEKPRSDSDLGRDQRGDGTDRNNQ